MPTRGTKTRKQYVRAHCAGRPNRNDTQATAIANPSARHIVAVTSQPVMDVSGSTGSIRVVAVWQVASTTIRRTCTLSPSIKASKTLPPHLPAGGNELTLQERDRYHPGYFGKVGMRYFHRVRQHFWKPSVNIEKLWSLVPKEMREKYLSNPSSSPTKAPVLDLLPLGYAKVLGKGRLPASIPLVVRARYFSRDAEAKIKEAGGIVQLVA
ncbi:MAG: 60S ribosomal protein L27A [Chrysothrix sp. TS-e1954]|nr:MAG: 60S ribosomal protein L27A [Chrysothrix sp. TS-e1954]